MYYTREGRVGGYKEVVLANFPRERNFPFHSGSSVRLISRISTLTAFSAYFTRRSVWVNCAGGN